MQVFPVDLAGHPYYAQAFNAAHHGTDIFAPRGTQVMAVDDGRVRKANDPKGGLVAYLTTADGVKYYYAHLEDFIGDEQRSVKAGDVIGTVGNSGNAAGKSTHLHFQVSLPTVGTVDPYPLLRDVDIIPAPTPTRGTPKSSPSQSNGRNWNGLVVLALLYFATRKRS